jgi:hypothetical protein
VAADAAGALMVGMALGARLRDLDVVTAVGFGTANLESAAISIIAVGLDGTTAGAVVQAEAGAALLVLLAFLSGSRARGCVGACQAKPKGKTSNHAASGAS